MHALHLFVPQHPARIIHLRAAHDWKDIHGGGHLQGQVRNQVDGTGWTVLEMKSNEGERAAGPALKCGTVRRYSYTSNHSLLLYTTQHFTT